MEKPKNPQACAFAPLSDMSEFSEDESNKIELDRLPKKETRLLIE